MKMISRVQIENPWLTLVSTQGKVWIFAAHFSESGLWCEEGEAFPVLSFQEKKRLESLQGMARGRFMRSRFWIRQTLSKILSLKPESLLLETGEDGKPFLVPGGLHVNWSHSEDGCVLACSEQSPVGIDLEFYRDGSPQRLIHRFFHSQEKDWLSQMNPQELHRWFFRLWSRKEAYFKCVGGSFLGGGLSMDLRKRQAPSALLWDFQGPFQKPHALCLAVKCAD